MTGNGQFAVTVEGQVAFLWDCATGRKIRAFQGHASSILCVAISAGDKQLVTGSSDQTAIFWDLTSGKKLQTFRVDPIAGFGAADVQSVALSADG